MNREIQNSVEALKNGKTILYPTDTVWGIGCDATNQKAVQNIYRIKQRSESKSLIVLLDDISRLEQYIEEVPEIAYDLIESITTPLTIIYPNAKNLAKNVVAKDRTIAIRITRDKLCRQIISRFGKPIVSSSANISGGEIPIVFSQVPEEIKQGVDYVVNLYHNRISDTKPSTIIKLEINGEFKMIRD